MNPQLGGLQVSRKKESKFLHRYETHAYVLNVWNNTSVKNNILQIMYLVMLKI
jgi:hypothetical protein